MLKDLEVPFEDLPNFLKPTINFEKEATLSKSKKLFSVKPEAPLINWVEKSADASNPLYKSNNMLTGNPFDRKTAMKAIK
jgi:hypothetical protein